MRKVMIKIAIAGIGNCASSLVQSINYPSDLVGLLHEKIGSYSISDIDIVAAFDIDSRKVGKDLSEAIFAKPNNTKVFNETIPDLNVKVQRGPTFDGIANHLDNFKEEVRIIEDPTDACDVVKVLKESGAEFFVNLIPVGSSKASEFYADACIDAGVNFINGIPSFICSDKSFEEKFKSKKLLCLGDDIKSQVGATAIHRALVKTMENRGIKIKKTYQLNFGGNSDFLNMLDRNRLIQKKESKTEAVNSQISSRLDYSNIHIGPSDYIPWLNDNKNAIMRIEGDQLGGIPMRLDVTLSVEDSPNSAAVLLEVIRAAKIAKDLGKTGNFSSISAWAFKHPSKQFSEEVSSKMFEEFIENAS